MKNGGIAADTVPRYPPEIPAPTAPQRARRSGEGSPLAITLNFYRRRHRGVNLPVAVASEMLRLGALVGHPRDDVTLGVVWSEQLHRPSTTIVAVAHEQGPMRTQQALHIHIERIGTRPTSRHHSRQTGPLAKLSIFECVR